MPTCYNNAFSASFAQDASHRAQGLGTLPSHRGGGDFTDRAVPVALLCFALLAFSSSDGRGGDVLSALGNCLLFPRRQRWVGLLCHGGQGWLVLVFGWHG